MFCPKCGNQLSEGQKFCANCGNSLEEAPQTNPQPSQQQNQYYAQQNPYQPPYATGYNPMQPPVYQYPMKWFKFLIYFALFAGAVINFLGGIMALTGAQYNSSGHDVSALVYAFFPDLKTIDLIYGVVCIALAVLAVYTRFSLARFKNNAPNLLYAVYASAGITNLVYAIAVSSIVSKGGEEFANAVDVVSDGVIPLIVSIVMIVLNKVYFDKRKSLFNA